MAEIKPFRAWRYGTEVKKNIEELTSPLFDVVSDKYRETLYQNPLNSIHLSVPQEGPDADAILTRIDQWKKEEVLVQDATPAIYVYYQYFKIQGEQKTNCRKGFIANIRICDWDEEVVLRHEDTIPHSVDDRKKLLEKIQLNVSPTHGLYTEVDHEIETYMDQAIASPVYDVENYQGVRDVLGVIHDYKIINRIMAIMKDKQVILADGHHRYQGALAHLNEEKQKNEFNLDDPLNYQMMYLTNTESDDLRIFPTHRLIRKIKNFDPVKFLESLAEFFHIQQFVQDNDLTEVMSGKKWAFGLLIGEDQYLIRLKQHKFFELEWEIPEELKKLDLTVMHYFIIEKVLKIKKTKQPSSKKISFERNITTCLKKVWKGKAQMAILTQEIPMESVKKVCFSGYTLPQKSTYFYPKAICGYLFGSIKKEDSSAEIDRSF